jgi:hypothetical protein
MVDDKSEKPSDASISEYLQLPLRTLEKAQQDRERARHRFDQAPRPERHRRTT